MAKRDNYWMFKAPPQLKIMLDNAIAQRIKKDKDRIPRSYKRMGLAIARDEKLFNDLINADFLEEKND
jgi:hypothetical protein